MSGSNILSHAGKLLGECTALEYILLGDLRDLLEEPADEQTCRWLVAVLDALLDTIPREIELQQVGGYLAEVLEQYPNWSGEVVRLKQEKHALYVKLGGLRNSIVARAPFSQIADQVSGDLCEWMKSFQAHHRHERRLVHSAFNIEVGTGD